MRTWWWFLAADIIQVKQPTTMTRSRQSFLIIWVSYMNTSVACVGMVKIQTCLTCSNYINALTMIFTQLKINNCKYDSLYIRKQQSLKSSKNPNHFKIGRFWLVNFSWHIYNLILFSVINVYSAYARLYCALWLLYLKICITTFVLCI